MVATVPGGTSIREEVKVAAVTNPHEIVEEVEDDSITEMVIPQQPSIISHEQ